MAVHPQILASLDAFRRRRRGLLLARGLLAAAALLGATMLPFALLDWAFVLPDLVRLVFALLGYAATLAALWFTGLRHLLRPTDPRRIARLMELGEPALREDLLSAVELGAREIPWDSPRFRELVQEDVAGRVAPLRARRLLPLALLRRWGGAAALLWTACLALLLGTSLRFAEPLARSLLPRANLGLAGAVPIRVLAPAPPDAIVPAGEPVELHAVALPPPDTPAPPLMAEIFPPDAPRERVPLARAPDGTDRALIPVGHEPLFYRIGGGRALTRKYRIEPRERPFINQFDKLYTPPAYARLSPTRVSESDGDLAGIEGSEATLELHPSQPIRSGELRIESDGAAETIPLQPTPEGRLRATVRLSRTGTYQVRLVAQETGFDNPQAPRFMIRADPDLPPRVEVRAPLTPLLAPAGATIEIVGEAEDDVGLAAVARVVQVNGGPWRETPLPEPAGLRADLTHRWALAPLALAPGDRVVAKLVAVDRKGTRVESAAIHVAISSGTAADPDAGAQLERRRFAQRDLAGLRTSLDQALQNALRSRRSADAELRAAQRRVEADASLEEAQRHLESARTRMAEAEDRTSSVEERLDIALARRMLERIAAESMPAARAALAKAAGPSSPPAGGPREAALEQQRERRANAQIVANARLAEEAHRRSLALAEAAQLATRLSNLAGEEERAREELRAAGDADAEAIRRLADPQKAAAAEARGLSNRMREIGPATPNPIRNEIHASAKDLDRSGRELASQFAGRTPRPAPQIEGAAAAAREAHADIQAAIPILAAQAAQAREALAQTLGPGVSPPAADQGNDVAEAGQPAEARAPVEEGSGLDAGGPDAPPAGVPPAPAEDRAIWSRLPQRLARDLVRGRREDVPEEYRALVDSYFRALAERARQESAR